MSGALLKSHSWPMVKVGDISQSANGRAFKSTEWAQQGTPIIRIQNLNRKDATFNYFEGSVDERIRVRDGDLLFAWSGTPGTSFGAHIWRGPDAALNQHIFKLRFDRTQVDSKFFYYALNRNVAGYIEKAQGGVGLAHVTKSKFENSLIPLPTLEEQQEVVAELEKQFSRLDEAVANLQRGKANLKRYKAAVLKAAVEGRLVETEATLARREGRTYETGEQLLQRVLLTRPDQWSARGRYVEPFPAETKDLSPLPDGWTWASIDQLSDFITKGTTPAATKLFDGAGEVQFLKVYNLTFDGSLNHTHKPAYVSRATHKDELARSQVFPGDVLINIVGPPLGQVSVVPAHVEEANINQAIARIRPIKPIGSDFVAIALMCDDIMRWAIRRGKTTAGQANLTLELCRALPIPVPPLAEQARIVAEVDRHLSIIREVEAEVGANLQRAQALRQATLSTAFSPKS